MDLSIIIVSYKAKELLKKCLQSVKVSDCSYSFEVIVHDNGSDDGTVEMIRGEFPEVKVIPGTNIGYSAGNNVGIGQATGRYILLLNPDTEVEKDAFKKMMEFMESNPDVGISTCKVVLPDGSLDPACRRSFPTPWVAMTRLSGLSMLFPKSRLFNQYNLGYLPEDQTYEVDACTGAFMLIRRSVLDKIGLMDEDFFLYNEDLDLCYRAKKSGFKIVYHPVAKVVHFKRQSTQFSAKAQWEFHRSMILFHKKHLAGKYPWLVNQIAYTGPKLRYYLKLLQSKITSVFRHGREKKHF